MVQNYTSAGHGGHNIPDFHVNTACRLPWSPGLSSKIWNFKMQKLIAIYIPELLFQSMQLKGCLAALEKTISRMEKIKCRIGMTLS